MGDEGSGSVGVPDVGAPRRRGRAPGTAPSGRRPALCGVAAAAAARLEGAPERGGKVGRAARRRGGAGRRRRRRAGGARGADVQEGLVVVECGGAEVVEARDVAHAACSGDGRREARAEGFARPTTGGEGCGGALRAAPTELSRLQRCSGDGPGGRAGTGPPGDERAIARRAPCPPSRLLPWRWSSRGPLPASMTSHGIGLGAVSGLFVRALFVETARGPGIERSWLWVKRRDSVYGCRSGGARFWAPAGPRLTGFEGCRPECEP
jgi:hypothetical protein